MNLWDGRRYREEKAFDIPAVTKYSNFDLHGGNTMFGGLGMGELLIILAIVVLIFGVNKIPQLGKGLGEGIRNFKDSIKSSQEAPAEKKDKN